MSGPEVITLGCRLNAAESEAMRALAAGEDDLIIVNSCAVTNEAVRQTRQAIRKAKRARPDARVVVTGCAAQVEPETFAAMPEVSRVVGNAFKLHATSFVPSEVEGRCTDSEARPSTSADRPKPVLSAAAGGVEGLGTNEVGDLRVADPLTTALYGFAGLVVSPGVPINRHPIAQRAREAKVPLIGDIELFAQARASLPRHKVVGITGTNGKSTTTALVHHILKTAGIPTEMGGNIGLPILAQDPLPEGGVYVLELSSYQIDLTQSLDCDVAVLLNVSPDHLDRYDGMDDYAASKARLFAMQSPEHAAVIAAEDDYTRAIAPQVDGRKILVSSSQVKDQSRWPSLQGPHNAQNVAAAVAVARELGVGDAAIATGLATYPGLPHRMERVREKDGVLFVNDSKATNPTSTAPALAAYPAIHWILGGLPKGDDLAPCEPYFEHVRAAYTIGEAGPMFAKLLEPAVPVTECGVLDAAVTAAAGAAEAGEVVLLSPACASFDQFRDYEARGEAFRASVEALV